MTQELIQLPGNDYYPGDRYGFTFRAIPALALPEAPTSPEQVAEEFLDVMDRAAAYADANTLNHFGDCFRQVRQVLIAPLPPQYSQWLPPSIPEVAMRLMAAAESAYVFGMVGSWNDVHTVGKI